MTALPKFFYFSEIGDEAILNTLWGKYIDAFDKVFFIIPWPYVDFI